MRSTRRRFLRGVGMGLIGTGTGRVLTTPVRADRGTTDGQTTDLADQVARQVKQSLATHDVPGASVALVDGDEVLLADGFGVCDRETGTAVTADTPFRIGSVSKPVTSTALMARLRRAELSPTASVADLLDAPVPDRYAPPSVAELVTHRAGLEDATSQLWISDADAVASLPTHLRRATIEQVRPPGVVGSYSNYGIALAGQVLAATRDIPFADAIEAELLDPMGATHSSFRQPLPTSLMDAHATGYARRDVFRNGQFPFVGLRPAGALSTTARDMTRFLRVHTNDGVVDGQRVLDSETVAAVNRQWATPGEQLAGMAWGFVENRHGDARVLGHSGATHGFRSGLLIIPEQELGVFVSVNSVAGGEVTGEVLETFLSTAIGPNRQPAPESDGRPTRGNDLVGRYRSIRRSETSHERFTSTFVNATTVDVRIADDGALVTTSGEQMDRWVETTPLVFEHERTSRRLTFLTDDADRIAYLTFGGGVSAFEPVADFTADGAVAVGATIGLASGALRPAAATVQRWTDDDSTSDGEPSRSSDDATHDAESTQLSDDATNPKRGVTDTDTSGVADGDVTDTTALTGPTDTAASIEPTDTTASTEPTERDRSGEPMTGRGEPSNSPSRVWWAVSGVAVVLLTFPVLLFGHFSVTPIAVFANPPSTFTALFVVPIVGLLGAVATAGYVIVCQPAQSLGEYIHYAVVFASVAGFVWLLWRWNLLLPP